MSVSYNTRKKNIKNKSVFIDPVTGQEKAAVGGKRIGNKKVAIEEVKIK
jgi:hypothetical protein